MRMIAVFGILDQYELLIVSSQRRVHLLFYPNPTLKDNYGAKHSPPVKLGMFEENKLNLKQRRCFWPNFRHVSLEINYWPHQVKDEGRPGEVYRADIHTSECHCFLFLFFF